MGILFGRVLFIVQVVEFSSEVICIYYIPYYSIKSNNCTRDHKNNANDKLYKRMPAFSTSIQYLMIHSTLRAARRIVCVLVLTPLHHNPAAH